MKDSTAVSNQWCMPVNFLGDAILFDPWSTQYKVKDHQVQFVKKYNGIIAIMTWKSDKKISLNLVKGFV